MKPTHEWVEKRIKESRINVKGGASSRKHKRPLKPEQQRRQQQEHSGRVATAETRLRRRHQDHDRYSINYGIFMQYYIVTNDGQWLGCYDRTIYCIPIHDHKRMAAANEHYQSSRDHRTHNGLTPKKVATIETKIDGYADIFARLPDNYLIEEMYPLDGNVYGIASDLFITLVRIIPLASMASRGTKLHWVRGTQWQWMIWSISSYKEKKPTHPLSVWTLPDHEWYRGQGDRHQWAHSLRPLSIDAASVLTTALGQLQHTNKHNDTSSVVANNITTLTTEEKTAVSSSSSMPSLSLPIEMDQLSSVLRFTLLPKPVLPPRPPPPPPPPRIPLYPNNIHNNNNNSTIDDEEEETFSLFD
jgi:hypothetical protein